MANIRIAEAVRNDMLQALLDRMDLGAGPATLKIYSGTQPANANTALSGNTLLATLTFSDPAGSIAAGVLTFDVIEEDADADADAVATFGRIQDSAGNVVFDGNVGTADALIVLNTTNIVSGGPVRINSFTLTIPASITF